MRMCIEYLCMCISRPMSSSNEHLVCGHGVATNVHMIKMLLEGDPALKGLVIPSMRSPGDPRIKKAY